MGPAARGLNRQAAVAAQRAGILFRDVKRRRHRFRPSRDAQLDFHRTPGCLPNRRGQLRVVAAAQRFPRDDRRYSDMQHAAADFNRMGVGEPGLERLAIQRVLEQFERALPDGTVIRVWVIE